MRFGEGDARQIEKEDGQENGEGQRREIRPPSSAGRRRLLFGLRQTVGPEGGAIGAMKGWAMLALAGIG